MDFKTLDNYCSDIMQEVYDYYERQTSAVVEDGGWSFKNEPSEKDLYEIAHQYIMEELGLTKAEQEQLLDYFRIDMEELRNHLVDNIHERDNL